jgi:hypothetical protein
MKSVMAMWPANNAPTEPFNEKWVGAGNTANLSKKLNVLLKRTKDLSSKHPKYSCLCLNFMNL